MPFLIPTSLREAENGENIDITVRGIKKQQFQQQAEHLVAKGRMMQPEAVASSLATGAEIWPFYSIDLIYTSHWL